MANGEENQESSGLLRRGANADSPAAKYRKEGMHKIESLDYEIIENSVYKEDQVRDSCFIARASTLAVSETRKRTERE